MLLAAMIARPARPHSSQRKCRLNQQPHASVPTGFRDAPRSKQSVRFAELPLAKAFSIELELFLSDSPWHGACLF